MHPVSREFLLPLTTDPSSLATMIRSSLREQSEVVPELSGAPIAEPIAGPVARSAARLDDRYAHGASERPAGESLCRYLDSFDWSLYQAGVALEERIAGAAPRELRWLDLRNDGVVIARQTTNTEPGFADALPDGPVSDLLAPILGIRRLLPMAEVAIRAQRLRVLNEDDKTVVRIVIEEASLRGPEPAAVALPPRLRLLPVRGYAREMDDTLRRLEQSLGFSAGEHESATPLFFDAMTAAGCRPGGYSTKLAYRIDPEQRADAAAKAILHGLFDTLEANVEGTVKNLDVEFLHDLRVATRRTRSALSQIKGVFAPPIVEDFKARFAWLQQVTGPVRDLDVYLLDFPTLRDSLPEAMRDGLEPLRDWLIGHYAEEQAKLAEALKSPRFQALRRDWRAFLEAPTPRDSSLSGAQTGSPAGPQSGPASEPLSQPASSMSAMAPQTPPPPPADGLDGERSIKSVADRRLRSVYQRLRREGRAITHVSPAAELHELRKTCKKLRYLMEFFESLYPSREMRKPIKQCKVLLDNLGSFQDLEVQAAHLAETARRMHAEGACGVATLLSMGALIRTMLEGQQRARQQFSKTFAEFDSPTNRAAFERLFGARGVGAAAARDANA